MPVLKEIEQHSTATYACQQYKAITEVHMIYIYMFVYSTPFPPLTCGIHTAKAPRLSYGDQMALRFDTVEDVNRKNGSSGPVCLPLEFPTTGTVADSGNRGVM